MNKFVSAIKDLDLQRVRQMLRQDPKWLTGSEPDGKNALHYLCSVPIASRADKDDESLRILKLLLKAGMDINAIHKIADKNCDFPATPLWYAYTRGRNEKIYKY